MRRNEQRVVTSQPVNIHNRLLENTMTYMAERNRNMRAKNFGRRSLASAGS